MSISLESREQNKQKFLDDLFYGSKESKSTIATEVLKLWSILPSSYKLIFNDVCWLKEVAQQYEKHPSHKLLTVINQGLQERKLISKLNIAAFITVTDTSEKYLQYKALTLCALARLSLIGEHQSKINAISNELRQYAQNNRKNLESFLPSLTQYSIDELIEYLTNLIDDDENTPKQQRQQLACFRNAFRDCYLEKDGIHRNMGPRQFRRGRTLSTSKAQKLDDFSDEIMIEVSEIRSEVKGKNTWQMEEHSEPERTLSLIHSPSFISRDRHVNMMQARAINSAILKNAMQLTCSTNHVSSHDIATLVKIWIKDLNSVENDSYAKVLLLMLLTGNTLEEVKKWTVAKDQVSGSTIGVKRSFKLPSHKENDSEVQFLYSKIETDYILPLPLNIVSQLTSFRFAFIDENDLKAYLTSIKKGTTLSSISRYMKQHLTSNGIDICLIELINGHDPQNVPARFYTQIRYQNLLNTFKEYHQHLVDLSDSNVLSDLHDTQSSALLGSPLYVNDNLLKDLFMSFKTYQQQINTAHQEQFMEQNHNLRVLELQILLGLVSGHRPVVDWFGTLDDIHFATGEYRIADKERALDYGGRVVVIPEIVMTKLRAYQNYCEEAVLFHANHTPAYSQRYQQALNSDAAFCFYIQHGDIEVVKPSSYAAQIDRILPLQPNWTRHYLRSYFHEHGFSDELCAAWLGHKHANQLPFQQFSQLSRRYLDEISQHLHVHISNLLGVSNA